MPKKARGSGKGMRKPAAHRFNPNQPITEGTDLDVLAPAAPKTRIEVEFDQPGILGTLFGEFDRNLVAIENRLGVYIAARGSQIQIEGDPQDAGARARRADRALQPHRQGSGN